MTRITSVELPTGVRLEYAEQGDPDGVAVLLVHGYTDSLLSFGLLLPHLPPDLRAIAFSQRGHGDSGRPEDGYAPGDIASDCVALMDALGIDAAIVVGHSAGGVAAQRLAADAPGRVLGLVLLNAFRSAGDAPAVASFWEEVDQLGDPVPPAFVREFQQSTLAGPVPAGFFAAVLADGAKVPARVWRAYLRGLLDADPPAARGTIAGPALLVFGDRDDYVSLESQERLSREIPGAELTVYPGTGHAPHWEEPESVAADVTAFALRVAGRAPANG